ncbi:MAG: hypothetical protein JSS27_20370 [Planctomycetes bacterium]|nr:hypothetical protein [Planctomycetota bacterium]
MLNRRVVLRLCGGASLAMVAGCVATTAWSAPKPATPAGKKPSLEDRTASYFAARKDMKPGELITRGDVDALVKQLAKEGYDVKPFEPLLSRLEPDGSLLARNLRSSAGKQLARQSAQYPMGYERLDHLARLPDGAGILQKLVDGPDGYKLVEYLAVEPGGKEMGRMLSQTPSGKNFNAATNKIYTADQLVKQLKESAQPKPPAKPQRRL